MTCNDCIHEEACRGMMEAVGYSVSTEYKGCADRCETFKNKADFVEVVRCRDCKNCSAVHWEKPIPHTTYHCDLYVMSEIPGEILPAMYDRTGYFYCALGERGDK